MTTDPLSRRERQLMDIIYRLGEATAANVREEIPDPPSYSTVRTQLGTLAKKGHLQVHQDGPRYVYRPTVAPTVARRSALQRVVDAFFGGRPSAAAVALLEMEASQLGDDDMARLKALVAQAESRTSEEAP